jgi:predicted nuclease of restriction endonuclease-like (RecB) superfamily
VPVLSAELQKEFPGVSGFSVSNLWSMAQFYTEYHDVEFLQPLVGEISWTKHIAVLNKCKDNQERRFYILTVKDEYTFIFMDLVDEYSERQLESAPVNNVCSFLGTSKNSLFVLFPVCYFFPASPTQKLL